MDETLEESTSSTHMSYDAGGMSSTDEMCDLALKYIMNLKSDRTEEMHINKLEALCEITSYVLSNGNLDQEEENFGQTLWLDSINSSMEKFPESVSIQETSCRCLTALLQERPLLCQFIGTREMQQLPLCYNIATAMDKHLGSSDLFKSACDAVLMILSHEPNLQKEFSKLDLHKSILLKISTSQETLEIVKAFQVLVYMSRENPDFKKKLVKEDVLSCISRAFEMFPTDCGVLKQAIALLGRLAEYHPLVAHQCVFEGIHLSLIHVLKEFRPFVSLLEVTIETLGMFCTTDGILVILATCGCFQLICGLMNMHRENVEFQDKTLRMFKCLVTSSENVPLIISLSNYIIPELRKVMETHPKSGELQQRCCEVFYFVVKENCDIAVKFIKEHFHLLFFNILKNFEDDLVLNAAADCIYMLACEHDLKNQMMFEMCKLGNTGAVNLLLQLSADVNYSQGSDTPLSMACKANNLELVQLLLTKGVTDMHHSLTQCLEDKRHKLAGFLLKRMGHDEDAGTISLTGLKLGTLKKDWLAPALIGSDAYLTQITSTRWLNLIRKSHHRSSVSSISSIYDDDKLTELSTTDISIPEDTASGEGSPALTRDTDGHNNPPTEGDECFSDLDILLTSPQQSRQRSGSRLSMSRSYASDSRLMTVAECSSSLLPEQLGGLNEAFLEKGDASPYPRQRGYSDSQSREKKTLPRSKSGSMIGADLNPVRKNSVRCLDLSRNEISNVDILAEHPSKISFHLSCIENLDFSHNKLERLPVGLNENMQRLRKLVLSHNDLNDFPVCVFTCSKFLEWVDLSHNNIRHVQKPRNHFMSFVLHLDLSHNSIKEFPGCVSEGFPLLNHLDLSYNYITCVPKMSESSKDTDEAIKLSNLQTLNLCHNVIKTVSASFLTSLSNLETFQASHNQLSRLPDNVASSMTKLGVVKLSHNSLVEKSPFHLSKFVAWLPNVHTVDVSMNGLTSIPAPAVWHSQRLKDLNVSCNAIQTADFTEASTRWPSLKRLDLSCNNLRQIPKGIGELKSLGQLNISKNTPAKLDLPNEMGSLGKLWEFLHTDVKLDLNDSLLRGRTRDLVGHLHARLKHSAPKPQRKVVICGPRGGGKTALLRLLSSTKVLTKLSVTEGWQSKSKNANEILHIQKWVIKDVRGDCRCCSSRRNVSLLLRMWEFSGDETSAYVHRCFLNETDLHILVFDASGSVEKICTLKPWLANIHDQSPEATIILVGTHMDTLPASRRNVHKDGITNRIREMRKCPGIPVIRHVCFVGGSSKNSSIDYLAKKLLNLAMSCNTKANQVHDHNMPKSFSALQDIMEKRAEKETQNNGVIHLTLLKKIVQDSKLDINNDELHEAVVCLRQSGLLVNYAKPAAKLNELFFLRPPKLAALIAKVVAFVVNVANPMELITHEKLCGLIVGEGFLNTHVPQILRLLEDFEIALPVSGFQYLLTSNLDRSRPSVLENTDMMLRRRYRMPYAPVGFWCRLIIHLWLYRNEMARGPRPLIREISEDSTVQFWYGILCSFWSAEINFTVTLSENILDIFVPRNRHGHVLLANLVYHIDTLLQEWYPKLCGVSSLYNRPIIQKTALCLCKQHEFPLEECTTSEMTCTGGGRVPLEELAPDLLLAHVDPRYMIEESDLIIEENPGSKLGEGSFGSVYRAKYKNKSVAVKVFRQQIESDPRVHLEHEVRFLAKLRHPSIIDLVGVCCGPRYIAVLELAPLGSLNMIFRSGKPLSRGIQHLIAMQVADGLKFLHDHTIVYRDLKPHNILIFSLAAGSLINAKISDLGSSCYATPYGLISPEGTPGYRAPEVARGDVVYNEKADIFSLGMLLYELATEGKQPFSDLKFRSEFDEAVITARPIDPLVVANASPWPDMQDLLDHMLVAEPDQRPTADQVYQRLSDPEFISLKQDIAVCKSQAVECMATRHFCDDGVNKMEVWIGSGASDWANKNNNNEKSTLTSQLSRVDLSSSKPKGCKGTILQDGRITCITIIDDTFILVGTQTGHLWVYDVTTATFIHAMGKLPDAVVCQLHVEDRVFVGLANGQLAMYGVHEFRKPPKATNIIDLSGSVCGTCAELPLMCLALMKNSRKLLCGVGHDIVVFQLNSRDMLPEFHWSVASEDEPHKGLVSNIVVDKHGIWTSTKGSSCIQLWNMKTQKPRALIKCDNLPLTETSETSAREMRVVSMLIHNNILWVGTGGGHILLFDTRSSSQLMSMSRHKTAVRCLMTAELLQQDGKQVSVVLSGGLGFVPRCTSSRESSSRDFGYVLVWESGIHKESEHLHEYNKRRREWHLNRKTL